MSKIEKLLIRNKNRALKLCVIFFFKPFQITGVNKGNYSASCNDTFQSTWLTGDWQMSRCDADVSRSNQLLKMDFFLGQGHRFNVIPGAVATDDSITPLLSGRAEKLLFLCFPPSLSLSVSILLNLPSECN